MKYLTILLCLIIGLKIHAQGEYQYHPILEEGKVWILNNTWSKSDKSPFQERVWIEKDTVVDQSKAAILYSQRIDEENIHTKYILKEENRQLYLWDKTGAEWLPVLDFNCSAGDFTIPLWDGGIYMDEAVRIDEEGIVTIFDKEYRYLKDKYFCWIEGIGSPSMFLLTVFPVPGSVSFPCPSLTECYLNDELIFSHEEWKKISSNSMEIETSTGFMSIYDLHGRPNSNPQSGSIYIQNGKKILWR